jgi:hypothetical protein
VSYNGLQKLRPNQPQSEDTDDVDQFIMDTWDRDFERATGKLPPLSRLNIPRVRMKTLRPIFGY